ncbi:MAG TPA: hypothetical protein VE961_12450 [Pyrinomonadaceae bacterium]|nr:hypothetical protein [Pyrinomonadaceae bacterium]
MLRAAPLGTVANCGPSNRDDDPDNDPATADGWPAERHIRAELIRWLCVDRSAREQVDPRGVRLRGARINGSLDLSFVTLLFPLSLRRCRIQETLDLDYVEIPAVDLTGSWIESLHADNAKVKGSVFLAGGFRADRGVLLRKTQIGGDLDCSGGVFLTPPTPKTADERLALHALAMKVMGAVLLRRGFRAEGAVRLQHAQIGAVLECDGGRFLNPADPAVPGSGVALNGEAIKVAGSITLRNGFAAEGTVRFWRAEIGDNLECSGTFTNPPQPLTDDGGVALNLEAAKINGSAALRDGFKAEGEVRLFGLQIGRNLESRNAIFRNPAVPGIAASGMALNAEAIQVAGSIMLRNNFSAEGRVRLFGARAGGDLDCDDASFSDPPRADGERGLALDGSAMKIGGAVLLRKGFMAEGEVRLFGVEIGRNLEAGKATFLNPAVPSQTGSGMALNLEAAHVAGSIILLDGFSATGEVRAFGARIDNDLRCGRAQFSNPAIGNGQRRWALNAMAAQIGGSLFLGEGLEAKGLVSLANARITGAFRRYRATLQELDLTDASVGLLADDEESRPTSEKVSLDGFTYDRIAGTPDVARRLKWLKSQRSFTRQPYRQLAKALDNIGYDVGARRVLSAMQRRAWNERRWPAKYLSYLLGFTIGYGYFPLRAIWLLLGLVILGSLAYWNGYASGSIVPTDPKIFEQFDKTCNSPPNYEHFHSLVYSLENSFPLVKLGVQDKWVPASESPVSACQYGDWGEPKVASRAAFLASPTVLRWFRWVQICFGWVLTTLFVGGVTGILRKA